MHLSNIDKLHNGDRGDMKDMIVISQNAVSKTILQIDQKQRTGMASLLLFVFPDEHHIGQSLKISDVFWFHIVQYLQKPIMKPHCYFLL